MRDYTRSSRLPVPLYAPDDATEMETRVELQQALEQPILDAGADELPVAAVAAGMTTEMNSMKNFDVYEEVAADQLLPEQIRDALPTMWVKKAKGAEVRCRLVCKGCYEETPDKDDVYASTPLLTSLKILLIVAQPGATKSYLATCLLLFYMRTWPTRSS